MNRVIVLSMLWWHAWVGLANGGVLSETQYVELVRQQSLGLAALQKDVEAAKLNERQGDLPTAMQWSASSIVLYDRRPPEPEVTSYKSVSGIQLSSALSQQTAYGTQLRLKVDVAQNHISELELSPMLPKKNIDMGKVLPSIEVSQPLWKNAWGKNISLLKRSLNLATQAQSAQFSAQEAHLETEARLAYVRLVFARERLLIATQTLETARKIQAYVQDKAARNLLEESDRLQAEGLVAARELEIHAARNETEDASLAFNALLGNPEKREVADKLEPLILPASAGMVKYSIDKRKEFALLQAQLDGLDSQMATEEDNILPELSVFGSAGIYTADAHVLKSLSSVGDPFRPGLAVGVRLTMTLDRDLLRSKLDTLRVRKLSVQQKVEEMRRNFQRDLSDLTTKKEHALSSLKLAEALENIQRKKLANAQQEYRNGRSTTYQLLLFSQDLSQSEFGRLQALYELRRLHALLESFAEERV
jgi:outer membrane protein TolC